MISKLCFLINESKGKGIGYFLKRARGFLFRPVKELTQRNNLLLNVRYSFFPDILRILTFSFVAAQPFKSNQTDLAKKVREFWYSNIPDDFDFEGEKISRKDIFTYGGPDLRFTCPVCQKSEWLSRIRQKNLFVLHVCPQSKECKVLCSRQGDELWTNLHQNFDFSLGCDKNLPAPRCLCVTPDDEDGIAGGFWGRFFSKVCDQWMLVFRRKLAYSCQTDLVRRPAKIKWENYDFLFVQNVGANRKFPRPKIPVIMYIHDYWPKENRGFQWVLDWLKPDILLTPCPIPCRENFNIPAETKIVFYPLFDSLFFERPNLGQKELDLLVVGATASPIYGQRVSLDKQIFQMAGRYKIEFSHRTGTQSAVWPGPTHYTDPMTKLPVNYLNKWSEYLGRAKYVIFGRMKYPAVNMKYYEALGSGAIPILPEVPDLKFLDIKPFQHYLPLSEVEGNNKKLTYYLDHYDNYKHIAQNAVKWYKDNSDRMIFNDFEDLVREITGYKYPKRLV